MDNWVRHQKKMVKMQEALNLGEEKNKRRHFIVLRREEKERPHNGTINGTGNGLSPADRSDSPTSTSTATSAGTVTPPSGAPPAPPPVTLDLRSAGTPSPSPSADGRSALLGSICGFDKNSLRRTRRPPP